MANNEQPTKRFDPKQHLIQLKSKAGAQDYLPVQFRLVWYRQECPEGTIDTEEVVVDLDRVCEVEAFVWNAEKRRSEKVIKQAKGYARFRAVVTDGRGGRATGTKSECAANFPDYIEKAESGAIGRALAALGYGTQFAPEFAEDDRIVDAPVERTPANNGNAHNTADTNSESEGATEQQLSSLHKLYQFLSKQEPADLSTISFLNAKKLIQQLSAEYKELRASKAS